MVFIKKIRPVRKSKYTMNEMVFARTKSELTKWRKKNRHKYKQIFYGSPTKEGGYYALMQTKKKC